MITLHRQVRFEEVDAAGIVFFARFFGYAHEAMEHFFAGVDGGYPGLIVTRRIGLPAVKTGAEFASPLRYGEVVRIDTTSARIGTRSADLRFVLARGERRAAVVTHTVVTTDLVTMRSCEMPPDVRRVLEAHLEPSGEGRAEAQGGRRA